jgi:hypothetical protein
MRLAPDRLWTGCQGALLGLLLEPIFLSEVVVSHLFNREALARALLERCARGAHAAHVRAWVPPALLHSFCFPSRLPWRFSHPPRR